MCPATALLLGGQPITLLLARYLIENNLCSVSARFTPALPCVVFLAGAAFAVGASC